VRLDPQHRDQAVAAVVANGGQVVELHAVRDSLETVLLDEVERSAHVNPEHLGVL